MIDHRVMTEDILRRANQLSGRRAANDQELLPLIHLAIVHALLSIDDTLRRLVNSS
jgi:hypothetical protein